MTDAEKALMDRIDREHRERARTLSEFVNKLLVKRKGGLPKSYDELLGDFDVVKRAAEHIGSCQAINEVRIALWPDEKLPELPKS